MTKGIDYNDRFPLGRIFLALDNPRHEPAKSEAEAIAELCNKEDVLPLARDIAKHGLNPLERFGLIAKPRNRGGGPPTYHVFEGNRRMCALKLLNDPELAPQNYKKKFAEIAETAEYAFSSVPVAIFQDQETVDHWLERIHNGPQGGIGRLNWDADQKQRHYGGSKNRTGLALIDYAAGRGMITVDERAGKLTTVQRFVGNAAFKEQLGLDTSGPDGFARTRPKGEFDKLVKTFMRDLVEGSKVNSRMNSDKIKLYARSLAGGASTRRVEPEALETTPSRKKAKSKPVKPAKASHVEYEPDIGEALKKLRSEKLRSLYHSIATLDLEEHTPICSVGVWAFFETLTALAGRNESTDFCSYLSKQKLRDYGFAGDVTAYRAALERIKEYGNTTKHHPIAGTFNGDALNNDMRALTPVLLKIIEEAATKVR
ncbi:MAG: hypothetical protein H7124_01575 [Phycisphaerales bacterium]|nr:hypothetical protein [Hyphomonadaceae bacterium]